jgi:hypothetical protein
MGSLPGQMAHLSGRPEDLAYPTRKLKSVRLIIAISEMDLLLQRSESAVPAKLAPINAVQVPCELHQPQPYRDRNLSLEQFR